jgi:uncharacterized protein (DUF4415 family)
MRKPMRPEMHPEMRPDLRPDLRPPIRPLTDEDGEVRELTAEDFNGMRPLSEVDPGLVEAVAEYRRKRGRPKSPAPKIYIGLRMAPDVVESVKASGPGYNSRVEQALRKAGFGAAKQKQAMTTAEEQILARLRASKLEPSAEEREAASKALAAALERPAKKTAAKPATRAKKRA